jgi:hypothetical protein
MVERTELLTPEPAEALGALLDVPVPDLEREGARTAWPGPAPHVGRRPRTHTGPAALVVPDEGPVDIPAADPRTAAGARAQGRLSFEYRHVVAGLSESGPPHVIHS